jgi:hypothetical protein
MVVGPHQLQGPNVRAAKRHSEIQVRIGVIHLDDLEQRTVADGDVRTGLENPPADRSGRDIVQHLRRAVGRQTRHQKFR